MLVGCCTTWRSSHKVASFYWQALVVAFTRVLYRRVCRSLFAKDHLLFSVLMTLRILNAESGLNNEYVR